MNTTIIEPCCAERQLPALLREQKGRATAAPAAPVVSGSPADTSSSISGDASADNVPSVQSVAVLGHESTAVENKKPRTPKPKKQ